MNKSMIIEKLEVNYALFTRYICSLSAEESMFRWMEKWTASQQLDHIYRSTKPFARIVALPKFIIKGIFGVANRPSKSYDELVRKYHSKLDNGGRASGAFIPQQISNSEVLEIRKKLQIQLKRLVLRIQKYSEQELDEMILPHPLLGKITIREMLYFTIYHVEHHHQLTKHHLSFLK